MSPVIKMALITSGFAAERLVFAVRPMLLSLYLGQTAAYPVENPYCSCDAIPMENPYCGCSRCT